MTPHLLLVEDDPDDILLFQDALDDIKWEVELSVCTDGDSAVDFLIKRNEYENVKTPNLILLDLNLPKRSGTELLQMILTVESARMVPCIVLSTSTDQRAINECYSFGANSYVVKPGDFKVLCDYLGKMKNYWMDMVQLPQPNA